MHNGAQALNVATAAPMWDETFVKTSTTDSAALSQKKQAVKMEKMVHKI